MWFQTFLGTETKFHHHHIKILLHCITPDNSKDWNKHVVSISDARGSVREFLDHVIYHHGFEVSLIWMSNHLAVVTSFLVNFKLFPRWIVQIPRPVVYWCQCMVNTFHPCWSGTPHSWCAQFSGRYTYCRWCGTLSLRDLGCWIFWKSPPYWSSIQWNQTVTSCSWTWFLSSSAQKDRCSPTSHLRGIIHCTYGCTWIIYTVGYCWGVSFFAARPSD